MFKVNIGMIDRSLRIIFGLSLIIATGLGYLNNWGYLGLILIATGMFRFCPLYRVLGINTCKVN